MAGDRPTVALVLLLVEPFLTHGTKRRNLEEVARELLGRPLHPLAASGELIGSAAEPSPVLIGFWEADGSVGMDLDFRGPYPRLAKITLSLAAKGRQELQSLVQCWGGALYRSPADERQPAIS